MSRVIRCDAKVATAGRWRPCPEVLFGRADASGWSLDPARFEDLCPRHASMFADRAGRAA